jgi:hypothetical protein
MPEPEPGDEHFYDDAEIAAVAAVRWAAVEYQQDEATPARSDEIIEVTQRLMMRQGPSAPHAMIVAMARWLSIAFHALAEQRGKTLDQYLDNWEMHLIEQHATDEDEDEHL